MPNYQQIIHDATKNVNPSDPIGFALQAVRPLAIEKLNEAIKNCRDCEIGKCDECFKTLPRGNEEASILVLCDFPTRSQRKLNKGVLKTYEDVEEWKILKKVMSAYHINQNSLFFINVVNCFPQKKVGNEYLSRQPNTLEMKNCKVFVDYAFKIVDPVMVLILGNYALNAVKEDVNIMKNRGEWITVRGVRAMPTYSPTHLLQLMEVKDVTIMEEFKADFCDDILRAFLWLQEEFPENNVLSQHLEKL